MIYVDFFKVVILKCEIMTNCIDCLGGLKKCHCPNSENDSNVGILMMIFVSSPNGFIERLILRVKRDKLSIFDVWR